MFNKFYFTRFTVPLLLIVGVLGAQPSLAYDLKICQGKTGGVDRTDTRARLLRGIKRDLILSSEKARQSFDWALSCFDGNQSEACSELIENLEPIITQQLQTLKITKALENKNILSLSRLSRNAILNMIQKDSLPPEMIGSFNLGTSRFTQEEREVALAVWKNFVIERMYADLKQKKQPLTKQACLDFNHGGSAGIFSKLSEGYTKASNELLQKAPLIAFIDGQNEDVLEAAREALLEIAQYNDEFLTSILSLKTEHADDLYHQVNLTIHDHEMGLANFKGTAEKVIGRFPASQQAHACASWKGLESQQSKRIKTSIGVGFTTAFVCGVGIWSGVGTIPATTACVPALADSALGAYRGYVDSRRAHKSGFSGRSINSQAELSEGIRTLDLADQMKSQGEIVMMVNLLGVLPVARGIRGVAKTKGTRGSVGSLAGLPASDSSVSFVEINAARLATLIELVRHPLSKSKPVLPQASFDELLEYQRQCHALI